MASFPLEASATNFRSSSAFNNAASPFRRMGWSSTERIRITLGAPCTTLHLLNQFRSIAIVEALVSDGGRNEQLNFGAVSRLAPHFQTSPDSGGAFTDAAQPPVAESPTVFKHLRFDTLAIVANSQAKHGITVPNLGLDLTCVRVLISISHEFERNPTNITTDRRRQGPTLPLFN